MNEHDLHATGMRSTGYALLPFPSPARNQTHHDDNTPFNAKWHKYRRAGSRYALPPHSKRATSPIGEPKLWVEN
jgi:hypothetical protein